MSFSQFTITALLFVAVLLMGGCANPVIPKFEADKVDCEYHREGENITWKCLAEGEGRPLNLPF